MTRIRLISLAVLALVLAAGGAATLAAFTATTSNAGNSFSAASSFGGMRVATGAYNGNGGDNRNINVAFAPNVVVVKGNNTQGSIFRTSSITGDLSKQITGGSAVAPNWIQSFSGIGFQVGDASTVNQSGIRYDWIAFRSYAGQLAEGLFTGNGSTQSITGLGFSPDYVIVGGAGATAVVQRSTSMGATFRFDESAAAANGITSLGADGFTLGNSAEVNGNGNTYAYIAWNEVGGIMNHGSYAGNNTDNRSITGAGFQPDWALVRSSTTGNTCDRAVHRPSSLTGDNTQYFTTVANLSNAIQALQADGFQVGTNCRVNANGEIYNWVGFKNAG